MNFLAFISSSAVQIYEIHILIISLIVYVPLLQLFCFGLVFLRPSNFFGPSGSRDKYEKERGYKYVDVLQGIFLYIMSVCDEYIINLSASYIYWKYSKLLYVHANSILTFLK